MKLQNIRFFLLDLDGTFYLGNHLLPGSLPFIRYLKQTGRCFAFLTNNSSHNAEFYAQKITSMGCPIGSEAVITSGEATGFYLREQTAFRRVFVLGTPDLMEELAVQGLTVTARDPECVVVGFDTTLDYAKLTVVCDFVRAGLPYVATHPDFNCPTETGFIPDCGAIMAFIQASAGRRPDKIIGKPNREIIDAVFRKYSCRRDQLAMVGDRLYTDIATGSNAGIASILVLTGETSAAQAQASSITPTYTFQDLAAIAAALGEADGRSFNAYGKG